MASSFNPKSNSSASRAPKPTYRRASAARSASASKPAGPAGSRRSAASSRAAVGGASKSAVKPVAKSTVRSGSRPTAKSTVRSGSKPVARPAARLGAGANRPSVRKQGLASGGGRQKAMPHGTRPVASPAAVRAAAQRAAGPAGASSPSGGVKIPKAKMPGGAKRMSAGGVKLPPNAKGLPKGGSKPLRVKTGAPKVKPQASGGVLKRALSPLAGVASAIGSFFSGLASRLNIPTPSRSVVFVAAGGFIAVILLAVVIANSSLLAATEVRVMGSDHMDQATAEALVDVPDGTTLLNVDKDAILEQLQASPWIKDVEIERAWPHTLVITPVERKMTAIAYVTADEVAWAIGDDGTWIAPVTLLAAVDAEGNEVEVGEDGSVPEGATLLSGQDAALRVAQDAGCLLLTDVPSDVSPKSGESVNSKVVLAGLEYANGFSPEFVAQIKSMSVASVEAISANLLSGVEVSLGAPDNIVEKERVVTKLLAEQTGVTYINVREPGAYTFRSAPQ